MTLGEYLVTLLEDYGVDTVFGIPGVHTVEMYRGLASSSIRHVTPRHEQGAGFMADGYARVGGKPGVVFVISGPGLTNVATAMGQAYADSVPMLVISAVNPLGSLGHGEGELHESPNQSLLVSQVAAFSFRVLVPEDLPKAVARAFATFSAARPRPVHIEIPVDLFSAPADSLPRAPIVRIPPPGPDRQAVAEAADLCSSARSPVIFLGGGARHGATEATKLAERLDAPAIMTVNGRGILPAGHPLEVSASPSLNAVRDLMARADLVLAFGTEFGRTDYNVFDRSEPEVNAPLIRADIDPLQVVRNINCSIALVGDARATLEELNNALGPERADNGGAERAKHAREAALGEQEPEYRQLISILEEIAFAIPEATVIGDSTKLTYAGNLYLARSRPTSWFGAATGFGALGYGLPASIGAVLAMPQNPVVCLVGDGGLQFTLAELGTAMEIGGPLIVLVWNNRGYGEIKSAMIGKNVNPVGVDLLTPDFVAIARSWGMQANKLEKPDDLTVLLQDAVKSGQPTLIEIDETLYF